jgi:phage terminase small subunit
MPKNTAGSRPAALPEHLVPIWDEMLPQVSSKIGAVGLEALCVQVHRMRDAQQRVTAEGLVVASPKGDPVPHPALAVEAKAQGEVREWLKRFPARSSGSW